VSHDPAGNRSSRIRVGSIVIRCRRFDDLVAFWQAALGYSQQAPPEDGWVILTDPTGSGPNISLDRIKRPPPLGEVSRVHLDFYTDDREGEVERLLALGATRYDRETGPDEDFVVLVDPDGNRFCVVEDLSGGDAAASA
jgi:catechol 2,3-dioxygenase-like lactoylglutathione lyase family enzyme